MSAPATLTASGVTALTLAGTVTAADQASRTISGPVLTIGEIGNTSLGPVRFASGSLSAPTDPSRIKLLVEHDRSVIAGYCTATEEREGVVYATFRVADGPVGDDVLASAAQKLRDGLSVGVDIVSESMGADGVRDVTAASWRETSVVAMPAFASAQVTQVAANRTPATPEAGQPATPQAGQQPAATPAPPAAPIPVVSFGGATATARRQFSWRTLPDQIAAAYRDDSLAGAARLLTAALSDIVPPAGVGSEDQHRVWFGETWLGELWYARRTERTLIDALGAPKPLNSFGKAIGYQIKRPALAVAEYGGNKAEIPTGGGIPMEFIERQAKRFAGGHDVDRAFFDFGDGSFVRLYFELQTENYLQATESWFSDQILQEATALTGAPTTLLTALSGAAGQLGRIGAKVDFIKVGAALWDEALQITAQEAPWLFGGSANLREGTATIGGLTLAVEPTFAESQFLAGDRRAATFYEWKNPPLKVEAVNVAQAGVDLALYGYAGSIVNDPASVIAGQVL